MKLLRIILAGAVMLFTQSAFSVIETYEFSNSQLQERYQLLSAELRCPKCQNQNIADSNAPIAQDLRRTLYEQLEAGASNDEILDYMVARYGEFVRYRPSFSGFTILLWLFPALILVLGAIVLMMNVRARPGTHPEQATLSEAEQTRLQDMLDENTRGDH